jgi:hypothetical protein
MGCAYGWQLEKRKFFKDLAEGVKEIDHLEAVGM